MSYSTWTTHGYGFSESDLGNIKVSEEQLWGTFINGSEALLAFQTKTGFLDNVEYDEGGCTDLLAMMDDLTEDEEAVRSFCVPFFASLQMFLITARLNELAKEKFGLSNAFLCTDDAEGEMYVLFLPLYPWDMEGVTRMPSEDDIVRLYSQVLHELYGEDAPRVPIAYESVENGG